MYSPPWVSQLEVAGHRGGLVAGSARQAQVWNTLLGTGGSIAGQTLETTLDHRDRKGVFEHPLNKNQERTVALNSSETALSTSMPVIKIPLKLII